MTTVIDQPPVDESMPAQDRLAEQAVLGIMLNSPPHAAIARARLHQDDFWMPAHAAVFDAIGDVIEAKLVADPATVYAWFARKKRLAEVRNGVYLVDLWSGPWVAAQAGWYIQQLRDAARVRRIDREAMRLRQLADNAAAGADPEDILDRLARQTIDLESLVEERSWEQPVDGLHTIGDFLALPGRTNEWIVPELIEREDVMLVLAGEGSGKTMLSRQMCQCIAAGIHPFRQAQGITPVKSLLIDLEVARGTAQRQTGMVADRIEGLFEVGAASWVWHRPQGLNLRKHADAQLLERVVAETGAQFIAMGSLYKAFRRGNDDWDTAAEDVREVFDTLRARHGVALWLEHHMPKGDADKPRPPTPFGSSVWQRWASHGRVLTPAGDKVFGFGAHFRDDREPRRYPVGLRHGSASELPWMPIWDPEELELLTPKAQGQGRRR